MKNIKIIIANLFALLIFSFASNAEQPYLKFGVSKLKTDYITIDGINLKDIYADNFNVYTFTGGYNFGKFFLEGRYFKSSKESKSGSASFSGVSVSGSTDVKFDGQSIGAGYNFQINDNFYIKPSIHYVNIDIDATINLSIAGSSYSFDTSGSDNTIEAAVAAAYKINDNSEIEFVYSSYLDDVTTTKDASTLGVNFSHKFWYFKILNKKFLN